MNGVRRSMGNGKMMVELFSAEIVFKVCKKEILLSKQKKAADILLIQWRSFT